MDWLETLRFFKSQTTETYKSIAEKTNIPQTTIEKLFCGRTKDPKLSIIRDIVHCLGHTLDDLAETSINSQYVCKLNIKENKLITDFRNLSEQGQEYILQTMDLVKDKYKKIDSISCMEKSS